MSDEWDAANPPPEDWRNRALNWTTGLAITGSIALVTGGLGTAGELAAGSVESAGAAALEEGTGSLYGVSQIPLAFGEPELGGTASIPPNPIVAAENVPATAQLATQIQGNVPLSAQTISLMETAEGPTIVTANGAGLTSQQISLAQSLGLTPGTALGEGFHAEINGLYSAGELGLTPTGGVTTNPMCTSGAESCFNQISNMASQGGYELQLSNGGKAFTFVKTGAQ